MIYITCLLLFASNIPGPPCSSLPSLRHERSLHLCERISNPFRFIRDLNPSGPSETRRKWIRKWREDSTTIPLRKISSDRTRDRKGRVEGKREERRDRDRADWRQKAGSGDAEHGQGIQARRQEARQRAFRSPTSISDRSYKTIVSFKYALKGEAMHRKIRGRWQVASRSVRPSVRSSVRVSIRAEDTRLESMGTTANRA